MEEIPNLFGKMVFNDSVMRQMLPKDIYKSLKNTIQIGRNLDLDVANIVANAMKEWSIKMGATHYTHWFQPMTGITAEKHDSFISPTGDGSIIMDFSGKELVRGEPDASSFPSGGLRTTFEARGYTAWDPTSYAFIKDGTLCIPTAFCSYHGEALDKKTPLLRSMDALNKQSKRILKLFGHHEVKRVVASVGPEQEYFLIDQSMYLKRPDLMYCGRTLFGARPPKGQELDDHYFGTLQPRVSAFMKELETELWKLGVLAKTKHNEVAPNQHELAPIFTTVNIATDHNQLTMELMKNIARKHDLACLLHEKPFAGVNGSGKHNNWSITTDTGVNLLEPGDTPSENAQFLLFLMAVIKAVDEYQDLLRISSASAGNDHRLGASEAPPAIISIFLGDELTKILEALENDMLYDNQGECHMEIGAKALPHIPKDNTDRNRTSPFAFTGNKFEFRMLGSSFSIACTNMILNTIVADALGQFADELEESNENFSKMLNSLIKTNIKEHKRIIFNGNNYSQEWLREATKRGLLNLKTTVDALPYYTSPKNVMLFSKHKVLSESELQSRYEILLESYSKTIHIEALVMIDMVNKEMIPALFHYEMELAELLQNKKSVQIALNCTLEENLLTRLSNLGNCLEEKIKALESSILEAKDFTDTFEAAQFYCKTVFSNMQSLRGVVDEMETIISKKHWPIPTYAELLNSVI